MTVVRRFRGRGLGSTGDIGCSVFLGKRGYDSTVDDLAMSAAGVWLRGLVCVAEVQQFAEEGLAFDLLWRCRFVGVLVAERYVVSNALMRAAGVVMLRDLLDDAFQAQGCRRNETRKPSPVVPSRTMTVPGKDAVPRRSFPITPSAGCRHVPVCKP